MQHPDQFAKLKQDPTLIKGAVEEILRYRTPVMNALERWAREDFEFRGHQFKKGDMIYVCLASANRDAAHCPHADVFDITRAANQHLSFGYGIHFCVGAPLARLEGRIALQSLLSRFPEYAVEDSARVIAMEVGKCPNGSQSTSRCILECISW